MKQISKVISFENFSSKKNNKSMKKNVNESAFKAGDEYVVKVTVDIPASIIEEYIEKVKSETGQDPLSNFSENEIAERIVQTIVKQNLDLESIPTVGIAVGGEVSDTMDIDEVEADAEMTDADMNAPEDEIELDTEEETGEDIEDVEEIDTEDEIEIEDTEGETEEEGGEEGGEEEVELEEEEGETEEEVELEDEEGEEIEEFEEVFKSNEFAQKIAEAKYALIDIQEKIDECFDPQDILELTASKNELEKELKLLLKEDFHADADDEFLDDVLSACCEAPIHTSNMVCAECGEVAAISNVDELDDWSDIEDWDDESELDFPELSNDVKETELLNIKTDLQKLLDTLDVDDPEYLEITTDIQRIDDELASLSVSGEVDGQEFEYEYPYNENSDTENYKKVINSGNRLDTDEIEPALFDEKEDAEFQEWRKKKVKTQNQRYNHTTDLMGDTHHKVDDGGVW